MEAPRAQKSTLKNFKKIATLFEKTHSRHYITIHMHVQYFIHCDILAHCVVSWNLFLEDHLDGKNTYSSYFVKRKDNLETRSPRNRPFLNLMVKRRWLKYYCVTQIYQELQKLLAYLVSILTHVHHPPKTLSIYMKVIEYYIYSWYK